MEDPQSSSHPFNSVNAIKTCFKSTNDFQINQPQVKTLTVNNLETPKSKEPEGALEDEFKDLHLKLPVLEVLAHDPMYSAILDKYVESLELGKNGSAFIQRKMPKKMKDPRLFTLPSTASVIIDCKKTKIAVGEGVTRLIFKVKEIGLGHVDTPYWTTFAKRKSYDSRPSTNYIGALPPYYLEKDFMNDHLPRELEIARDAELNPFKDVLVFRKIVEFLGVVPINLKGNMWESDDLIEKKID
ncbi:hypothetical protein Tco_0862316 [Tanacetum coccineum]